MRQTWLESSKTIKQNENKESETVSSITTLKAEFADRLRLHIIVNQESNLKNTHVLLKAEINKINTR